jgi:hypothetical protein
MIVQLTDRYISGIWDFHDGDAVLFVRQVPIFRRKLLFPSSERKLDLRFSHR